MAGNMHVKMFLDLVNRLSGPAKAAKGDLKGVADAARKLKGERGGEQLAKDLAKTQQSAVGASRGLKQTGDAARALKGERVGDQMAKDLERARQAAARATREMRAMKAAMRELAKTTALVNMAPALAGTSRKKKGAAGVADGGAGAGAGGGFGNTARGAAVAGALGAGKRALVPLAAGLTGYGAVRGSVGSAVSFEKEMAGVKIKLDGMNDPQEYAKMENEIRAAAIQYARTREEVARLVAEGGASGITKEQMPEFIKLVSSAAAAWDQSAETVSNALAKVKAQTGATLPELTEFGDLVNSLSDAGASKEMDVVDMFKRAGEAAKASGLDMKTTLAALTAMNNVGMEPEIAARGFAAMAGKLRQATEQGTKFQDGLKLLGLDAKKLESGMKLNAAKTMVDLLERVEKSADKGKAAIKLMGQEWWDEFLRLAQALPELKKNLKIVSDPKAYQGSMNNSLNVRLGTTASHLETLKTLSKEVGDRLGRWTLPHINEGIQKLVNLLNEVDARAEKQKGIKTVAQKLSEGEKLTDEERKKLIEDKEFALEAERQRSQIDQKKDYEKSNNSMMEGGQNAARVRSELMARQLDRRIEQLEKDIKSGGDDGVFDPIYNQWFRNGKADPNLTGKKLRLQRLKNERETYAPPDTANPVKTTDMRRPADASDKNGDVVKQQVEAVRVRMLELEKKLAALSEVRKMVTNKDDVAEIDKQRGGVNRQQDQAHQEIRRILAPNAVAANRFKPGKTGAGEANEAPAIPRGPAKFGLGGPATAGGGGVKGTTPTPEEAAAKWKNVAHASAEDLKAAFNIDLGEAGMTMMERLSAAITSGGAKAEGAAEGVGNGVKTKLSSVDLNGAGLQMMQGLASGITAGGAQAVAAAAAVAAQVKSTLAGAGSGVRSASLRGTLSNGLHDGVA